jgi:hypothetical protein
MTSHPPKRIDALMACDRLMQVASALRLDLAPRDPEGRSLSLGVCMFVGVFLSTIPEEYRQQFCDAANGYALRTRELLQEIEEKGKA